MSLNLMYITNDVEVARIAQCCGVDRIFVDMEYIGKEERQPKMDTVKSHHTVKDVRNIRTILTTSELLVRVNPIHEMGLDYGSSKQEIDDTIAAGADILMLPMVKTKQEAQAFVSLVNGRAKTMLLIETLEAVKNIDEILSVKGIDEIHVGLNDLHLSYGKKFMFELLVDGTVEYLCDKFQAKGIPYGFGGIARLKHGMIPAENIIMEHYRLGSSRAILSRSFCNANLMDNNQNIAELFSAEMKNIRAFESTLLSMPSQAFIENQRKLEALISKVVASL